MAGWSIFNDGSGLHDAEIAEGFKSLKKLYFDLDSSVKHCNVDDCNEKLRTVFDQVLLVSLSEVSGEKRIRPIPALLGDGQQADLFKLFWVVWKRGGYDLVSRNGLWVFVAQECGLDIGVMASIKLVYMKYLYELDQWLQTAFKDESLGSGESEAGGKLGLLMLELQKEFRGLLCDEQDVKKKDGQFIELQWKENGKYKDLDIDKRELLLPDVRQINGVHANTEITVNDDDENFCVNDENNVTFSDTIIANQVYASQKRKRESMSLSEMLSWVIKIAKHPDDLAIGRIPDCPRWKDYSSKEFWVQSLLAREVLLTRRHMDSDTEESLLQKKLKMHPSMYEDRHVLNHRSTEGLRCSERVPSLTKSRFCPCCNSCSASQNKVVTPHKGEVENNSKVQARLSAGIMGTNPIDGISKDETTEKHVSVGILFQVEVPEWTGVVMESDSKWLGTRMWPPENGKHNSLMEIDPSSKGRQDSCTCNLPDSVKCIRFHIAEKRMKLKLELGPLFYHWRFDRMGEEVSLSWTIAEEKRFKGMVRLKPPSLNKCFWDIDIFKFFPTKTMEKLVSYYFNVFLVRRRAYQNRVTPKDIDSDDDESEFGCVGDSYGYEALNVPGSKLPMCSENKQCTDL